MSNNRTLNITNITNITLLGNVFDSTLTILLLISVRFMIAETVP